MSKRYCIIGDNSGHKWICPLDRKKEIEDNIAEIEEYWDECNYDTPAPEPLTNELTRLEGHLLTFTNPQINGLDLGESISDEESRKLWKEYKQ